jgi:hypothetical protein
MKYFQTLIEIVKHPQHYRNFATLPGQFDAAEELLNDYWDDLKAPVKKAVTRILVTSGKYSA